LAADPRQARVLSLTTVGAGTAASLQARAWRGQDQEEVWLMLVCAAFSV
jgi:hypothetical protein